MTKRTTATPARTPDRPSTVLVTGAAGCVGAYLVDELLDHGYRVVATDRRGAPVPAPRPGLDWHEADLTDPAVAPRLCAGVNAVIHTAAWVDIAAPFAAQAPINLYAVRSLHAAAAAAGATYFLHFSTGSIYATKDGPIAEDDPLLPTSSYERAKLLAEDFLRAQAKPPAINIVRPTLIYGPRGRVLLAPLATLPTFFGLLDGWIPRLRGGPKFNVVHGHDVARAAVHLLEHRQPHLATFNVTTPEVLSGGELLATVLRTAGLTTAALEVPYPGKLVKAILPLLGFPQPFAAFNAIARALWRVLAGKQVRPDGLTPRVDMEATAYLGGDTIFDPSRLLATGFTFRYPTFEAGWRQTLDWYQGNRWIPPLRGHAPLQQAA
jgi:nucleoside-diphosphate-sugar epimerase